jgi:hypothetical protein
LNLAKSNTLAMFSFFFHFWCIFCHTKHATAMV